MGTKERIHYFDNIKGIMILLVVLGHFLQEVTQWEVCRDLYLFIYAFHMPVFFVISGYFHSNKKIANKAYFFLLVGLFTKFMIFIGRRYFGGADITLSIFTEQGTPWFMFIMAAFIVTAYLLRTVDSRVLFAMGIIIGCFVGYDKSIGDHLILSRFFVFFPMYMLGIVLRQYADIEKIRQNKALRVMSPIAIIGWLVISFLPFEKLHSLIRYFTGRSPFSEDTYMYGPIVRICCYVLAVVLTMAFIISIPNKKNPLTVIGERSIQVYFLHRPLLYAFAHFGLQNIAVSYWGVAAYIIFALSFGAVLALKIFSYPTDILRKLCFMTAEKEVKEN